MKKIDLAPGRRHP